MKIIVVEDEPKSREGILNILARDTEYEVAAVCGNGKEGGGGSKGAQAGSGHLRH